MRMIKFEIMRERSIVLNRYLFSFNKRKVYCSTNEIWISIPYVFSSLSLVLYAILRITFWSHYQFCPYNLGVVNLIHVIFNLRLTFCHLSFWPLINLHTIILIYMYFNLIRLYSIFKHSIRILPCRVSLTHI